MIKEINIVPNYRYERKFTAANTERDFLLQAIRRHPALFREIFYPRQVNNIYLDTQSLQFYHHNKIGIAERKKIRIRWYGDTFGLIKNPKLEYKLKSGLLGDKWTFDLNEFEITPGFDTNTLIRIFEESNLPDAILSDLRLVQPSLLNTYKRTYFLSADTDYRLTFDEQMTYYQMQHGTNHFLQKHQDMRDFILELKYGAALDNRADSIAQHIPYRMDKSSKYVNGIDYTRQP